MFLKEWRFLARPRPGVRKCLGAFHSRLQSLLCATLQCAPPLRSFALCVVLAEQSRQEDAEAAEAEDLDADMAATATATATENAEGGIDLNIDLDILQGNIRTALLTNRLLGPHWACRLPTRRAFAGKKVLTLTEYKRRKEKLLAENQRQQGIE